MYDQEYVSIDKMDVLDAAHKMKNENYRLMQMCLTKTDKFYYTYSFFKDYHFVHYTFETEENVAIPSISGIFAPAFLYENEMKDLYGVDITNISLDFQGHFYKTSIKTPFRTVEKPAEKGVKAK